MYTMYVMYVYVSIRFLLRYLVHSFFFLRLLLVSLSFISMHRNLHRSLLLRWNVNMTNERIEVYNTREPYRINQSYYVKWKKQHQHFCTHWQMIQMTERQYCTYEYIKATIFHSTYTIISIPIRYLYSVHCAWASYPSFHHTQTPHTIRIIPEYVVGIWCNVM